MPDSRSRAFRTPLSLAMLGLLVLAVPFAIGARTETKVLDHLYGVDFVSPREAWAVGAFGVILHTADRGESWSREASGTLEHLFGIDFVDARRGWVVGRAGTILRREPSGEWRAQSSGTDKHLFRIAALSPDKALAIGDWGAILRTTDAGRTWTDESLGEDVILNDVDFVDEKHGWIAAEFGSIFVSSDGGETWSRQETGVDKTLFGLHFADRERGWAVGLDGVMIRTEDGGRTWTLERGEPTSSSLARMGFLEALANPSLYDVDVVGKIGVAVGDMGTILVSRDGGLSWERENVPTAWSLRWMRTLDLVAGSGPEGLLVGSGGLAIPVVDGKLRYPSE